MPLCRGERQRLANILILQLGVFAMKFLAIRVVDQRLHHPPHGNPQIADARLTASL